MMHFFLIGVMIFTTGEGKKISSSWDVKNLRFPDPNRQYRVRHGIATIESEYLGINMSILVLKHQNYKKTTFFHQFTDNFDPVNRCNTVSDSILSVRIS